MATGGASSKPGMGKKRKKSASADPSAAAAKASSGDPKRKRRAEDAPAERSRGKGGDSDRKQSASSGGSSPLTPEKPSEKPSTRRQSRSASKASSSSPAHSSDGGVAMPPNDPAYDRCWARLLATTSAQCQKSEIAAAYGCEAIRRSGGIGGGKYHWEAVCGGNPIGMYTTKEEAIKRAICAAMVWAESAGGGAVDLDLQPPSSSASKPSPLKAGGVPGTESRASSVARAGGALPSSGKQAPPLSSAASGTDSAKTQSSVAPSTQKAASNAVSPQRAKSVEMSDVDTREVIQIFRSSAQAAKMTGLRRADIANACKDGGGQVEGRYFRFVYLNAKGGPTRTSLSTTESMPSSSVDAKKKESGAKAEPTPASSSSPPATSAPETADDIMGDEDDMVDVVGDGEAIKPRASQKEDSTVGESDAPTPIPVASAVEGDATVDASVTSEAKKKNALDLVTLIHPLRSSSTRFKKYIELIDPEADQVLVCFRGSNDAHDALGRKYDKKVILKACAVEKDHDSKKKDAGSASPKGKPLATVFGTFRMRYAPSDCPPTAYVFGAHEEDFRPFPEGMTHADIVTRWAEVYASERRAAELGIAVQVGTPSAASSVSAAGGGGDGVDDYGGVVLTSTSQVVTIGGPLPPQRRMPQRYRTGPTSEEVLLRSVSLGPGGAGSQGAAHAQAAATAAFGGGRALVTIRRPPPNEDDMACVVCQGAVARIVFEPCHHCVLCVSCSEGGYCRRFCPQCRAPIKGRIQPSFVRLIRPRIFSAHSFM